MNHKKIIHDLDMELCRGEVLRDIEHLNLRRELVVSVGLERVEEIETEVALRNDTIMNGRLGAI